MDAQAKRFTEDDYDIVYHPDRQGFELITSLQDHAHNIGAAKLHLWLSASLIREMADLLPPQPTDVPPEGVH